MAELNSIVGTPDSERSPWRIATACDIGLGQLFHALPELRGKYLSISPEAIQQTLDELGYVYAGDLLFRAGIEEPNLDLVGDLHLKLGLAEVTNDGAIEVHVAIGGILSGMFSMLSPGKVADKMALMSAEVSKQHELEQEYGIEDNKQGIQITADEVSFNSDLIIPIIGKVFSDERIQGTAVHELQHASDINYPGHFDNISRFTSRMFFKARSLMLGAELAVIYLTHEAYEHMSKLQEIPEVPLVMAAAGLSYALLKRREKKYYEGQRTKLHQPLEERADAAKERAVDFPKLISIKDQEPQAETLFSGNPYAVLDRTFATPIEQPKELIKHPKLF